MNVKERENARYYLISNISNNISNLISYSKAVQNLAASINHKIGGLPSGADIRFIAYCQRASHNISQAIGVLHQSLENAKQLI